ncbi:MAG: transketolase family protein [Clostridia bacterium]|nr:transketolase family protein [Clostridia bacterium]
MNKEKKIATRASFGEALKELGDENEKVVVLTADLNDATKTSSFSKAHPNRFFDMGIAESNMIGVASGLATCGKIPFASSFAVFATGRAYDQLRASVAYPNLNVKVIGTHYGLTVGEDGATHQMLEDISLTRGLPNFTVLAPSDDVSAKWAVKEAAKIEGPVYLRFCRAATPVIYDENQKFELGKGICFGEGTDGTIFATGDMVCKALEAQELLEKENIHVRVVDFHTIKPIDKALVLKCAKETEKLISIEDHSVYGGLGDAIADVLISEYPKKLIKMGVKDEFGRSGKAEEVLKYYGLTTEKIIENIKK